MPRSRASSEDGEYQRRNEVVCGKMAARADGRRNQSLVLYFYSDCSYFYITSSSYVAHGHICLNLARQTTTIFIKMTNHLALFCAWQLCYIGLISGYHLLYFIFLQLSFLPCGTQLISLVLVQTGGGVNSKRNAAIAFSHATLLKAPHSPLQHFPLLSLSSKLYTCISSYRSLTAADSRFAV